MEKGVCSILRNKGKLKNKLYSFMLCIYVHTFICGHGYGTECGSHLSLPAHRSQDSSDHQSWWQVPFPAAHQTSPGKIVLDLKCYRIHSSLFPQPVSVASDNALSLGFTKAERVRRPRPRVLSMSWSAMFTNEKQELRRIGVLSF